jgi:uncharacterized protein YecT (DUF1311 family)
MKSVIISLALLGSLAARADINQIDTEFSACMDKAESTADQNNCVDKSYKAADAELNKVYNIVRTPLLKSKSADDKEILKRLVSAEKAWVAFRDANCSLVGTQMMGGSGEGPMIGGCLVSTTIARVKELQGLFIPMPL